MWTTQFDWNGSNWIVSLSRDGVVVAELTLDDWAKLSATKYLVEQGVVA